MGERRGVRIAPVWLWVFLSRVGFFCWMVINCKLAGFLFFKIFNFFEEEFP